MRKIIRDRMILTETQTETENERVKQSKREMHRHPETRVYKKWSWKKNHEMTEKFKNKQKQPHMWGKTRINMSCLGIWFHNLPNLPV